MADHSCRIAIIALLVLLVAGCSGRGSLYWGWACGGEPRTGEWRCDQKLLQEGRVVDPAQFPPEQIPPLPSQDITTTDTGDTLPKQQKLEGAVGEEVLDTTPTVMRDLRAPTNWQDQLPALDGQPLESEVEASPLLTDQNHKPVGLSGRKPQRSDSETQVDIDIFKDGPPKAESYTKPVFGNNSVSAVPLAEEKRLPNVLAGAELTRVEQPLKAKASNGYLIQLAALSTEQDLQQFVDEHQLYGQSLQRYYIFSRQRYWYVLALGPYIDAATAQGIVVQLQQDYPGLNPWVRSMHSLQKAVVNRP